jgi:hypothetical protein
MRVRLEPSGRDPEMEMKDDAPIEISVSDSNHAVTINELVGIRNIVAAIINDFRPRFDI